jgi:hypothetical protein
MLLDDITFTQFIPDLINVLFLLTIIIIFIIRFKIKDKYFVFFSLSLFMPFLFYFFWHWSLLPDQSKYIQRVYNIRNLSFEEPIFSILFSRIDTASLLLALFPIPFVSTIVSVALINKAILLATVIYFISKKKYYFVVSLLLFLPSMIVVSSVALRDMLVIAVGILFFYFFIEKKNYFKSIFYFILFLFIKPHLAIISLTISISYLLFFEKLKLKIINKGSFIALLLTIIFISIIIFFFSNYLINYRSGFISEEFNYQWSGGADNFSILSILLSFFMFLFSPLSTEIINLKNIIIFIENIFVIYLLIILLKLIYRENKIKAIFWVFVWFLLFIIFGFVLVNAGTIWRYKIVLEIIYLSAIYFSLKKKKEIFFNSKI